MYLHLSSLKVLFNTIAVFLFKIYIEPIVLFGKYYIMKQKEEQTESIC